MKTPVVDKLAWDWLVDDKKQLFGPTLVQNLRYVYFLYEREIHRAVGLLIFYFPYWGRVLSYI